MNAADRDSLSKPLGEHPQEQIISLPSSCFSDVIVKRNPRTSSASPSSLAHGSSKLDGRSWVAPAKHASGRLFVSSTAEKSSSDFPAAGWAARGAQQFTSPASLAPFGAAGACADMSETGWRDRLLFEKSAAVSMPYSLRARDIRRGIAASGRSLSSSRAECQPVPLTLGPTAAHYKDTAPMNTTRTAEANHCHVGGAAARPAVHVVRVHRLSHQQQQQQRGERASERSVQRRISAVAERENDAELQQIARQEQEASDDDSCFTMGEIIERSTDAQQQQQQSSRSREHYSQQKMQQQQVRPQLQQLMRSPACVSGGPIPQTAQQDAARRYDAVAAPANVAAAAASSDSGETTSERRIFFQLSRVQESVIREPHVAVEAPVGFPEPVHRSVLQQLLRTREGERLSHGHRYMWGEQQQQRRGEKQEAQKLQQQSKSSDLLRSGLRVEERRAGEGTQTTACLADSDVERHSTTVRSWRLSTADNDRAQIDAEAAELLRAMQTHEIAAARQELLDRFGPRRFAALQRRALRRTTSLQQGQLTRRHDGSHHQRVGAAETADQKSLSQETASGRPVIEGQQMAMPSGFPALLSSSHSAKSAAANSGSTGDLSGISAASPAALVSFAVGSRSNTITRGDSAACGSIAAAGKSLYGDDTATAAADAALGTAAVLPGTASVVRFDLHEAAKLRWADPLGPEDWQQGPVGCAADTVGKELLGTFDSLWLQQQSKGPRGALCGVAEAAEVSDKLPAVVAASNVYVKLERLRFDFDGCLRSDLFHAEEAVGAAVSGARAAAMRRRRLRRIMSTQQLKHHSQQLTEQGLPKVCMQQNKPEGTNILFLRNGMEQGAKIQRGKVVDIQTESAESTAANILQDASEDFIEETSDESDPLEFYRGLHHHGDAAALPGYTLPELLHLAQSSNQAQAALALQTLAAVIRTGKTLFTCPSIAKAAAFAASLRRWADQQQRAAGPSTTEEPHPEARQCETHLGEEALQQQQNKEEQSRRNRQSPLPEHHRQAYVTQRQRARDDSSCCESVAGAAADSVDGALASSRDNSLLSDVYFEAKAGYGVGLRRWLNYITRDLHQAWRLHALLHAQAAAVHRAALSCLAALFGPPALSGMHQVRAAAEAPFVCVAATRGRGAGSAVKDKSSSTSNSTSSSTSSTQSQCLRESRRLFLPNSRLSDSSNNTKRGFSGDAKECDSEPAVHRGHEEVLLPEQRVQQGVSKDENLSEEAERVAELEVSERNVSGASVHQDDARWGPGWVSLPLHMKKLPRDLMRQLFGYHHFDQGHQQQKVTPYEVHSSQKARQQQNARLQQAWPYGDRAPERHWQGGQKGTAHRGEIEYVCTWSLGGLDFVSEGLLVLDCCSGLRRIDSSRNSYLFYAEAIGEDSSAGCRGVFAFWHAFFGRIIGDAAAARAGDPHRRLQQAGSSLLSADEQPSNDKQKAGEEEKRQQDVEKVPAFPATERSNLKEQAAAGHSEVAALEARSPSVRKSVETVGNDSGATSTADVETHQARAAATNTMPGEGMGEDFLESREFADASEGGESTTAFFYDSVGALFSSSPVEALLGCGNLLSRLALLLSIYRTDEDVERSAIRLLIGLSAGGRASVTYMLSHAPLQERIRSLAEGLLVGSAARSERMQRQRRHENLAVATSRAAADASSSTAAGVYFVSRAEIYRQTDHSTKNSQRSSIMTGSGNKSSRGGGLSRSHNDDDCSNESYRALQGKVEFACDKANTEVFFLRRTEYFLLRELLVLLRLWAGWAPSTAGNGAEADAAAAWKDTLVGHESACCALLLQTFTSGISLLEAAAATKEALQSTCRPRDVTWSEAAGDAATAAAPQIKDGGQPRRSIRGSHDDMMAAEPGDENVLIAAVEAARVLRMLEARGVLRNIFASIYPSAVHVLHAFTRRLEKMQEELLPTNWQDESRSRPQGSTRLTVTTQREEQYKQDGSLCELEVELKQQMEELQQHDLDMQKQGCWGKAAETSEFLRELEAAGLNSVRHHPTGIAVGDVTFTHGTKEEDETDAKMSSSCLENIRKNLQHDVAVMWIFQGALIRELLRWGAVAAMKEEPFQDATADAYDFLVQVAPLLCAVPSLLSCWKQIEYHSKVPNASFLSAAAVQVVQAAMQVLLRASGKLARAVCTCIFCMSPRVDGDCRHDLVANGNVPADSHYSTSCSGSSHSSDDETTNRDSTTAETLNFRRSRTASGRDTIAVQQVAMKCWMSLAEPLIEILIESAEEQPTSGGCNYISSATRATFPFANRMCQSDIAAVSGVAGVGCCAEQESEAERLPAEHGYGCAYEKGKLKPCGALLHVMKKMRDACSHKGGSSIAKALSSYAVETGWTCLTSCCCSQCLPYLPEKNPRYSCGETSTNGKPVRPLRCSRWRGFVPATSESFAGTELETHFAALFTVHNSCSVSAPRRCGSQTDDVHRVSATSKGSPDIPFYPNLGRPASCSATADSAESCSKGKNNSYYAAKITGVSVSNSCDNISDDKDICVSGTKCSKNNAVAGALASCVTSWLPQDVELFLSEASFLSTACNWIASSLHLLHHWRASDGTCDAAARLAPETESSSSISSGHDSTENKSRQGCTVQGPSTRGRSLKQAVEERDGNSRSRSLRSRRPAICGSDFTDSKHCNVFSFNRVEKLAVAAAGLASALRCALQYLFRELRWPRQSPSSYPSATRRTAEVSGISVSKTVLPPVAPWKQQQGYQQYHETQSQQQRNPATRRQYELENCVQHQATATSGPLLLLEPLAQLMLSLQLLLRAFDPSLITWTAADEQGCLLAACSAAATPRTFLRALLLLYHSVMASSQRHRSLQQGEQVKNESHSRPDLTSWLKGAARWYTMCCSVPPPVRHRTASAIAESAGETVLNEASVYEVLVRAAAAAQSGVPLRQQTNASEGVAWPWVLCAADSLEVLVYTAEMEQQERFAKKGEKNEPAYTGTATQRTQEILFSQQLAVCPIDVVVGGGIWQCFCCDAALAADHHAMRINSDAQPKRVSEALSLCHLVLSTPNFARELSHYVPPGAIFAALLSLYAESHLAGRMESISSSSSRVRRQETAIGVDMRGGSAFSIYARPGVYDIFCQLLAKLLLQPLGKQLRDHALGPQPESQRQSQNQEDQVVWGAHHHQERQMRKKECERRLECEKEEQHQRQIEKDQRQEERCPQETHQQLDRRRLTAPLFSCTQAPSDVFYFSSAFLAIFSRACQIKSTALLGALPSTACSAPPASVVLPQGCLHWFPVCCNKAHDVLVEQTARLLLISQNAAEAADPLLSLLLWLLSSPAFPLECRRMLLRGEQTWLKVASQLFCFVDNADVFFSQRAHQQLNHNLQPKRPLRDQKQGEQLERVTQLACHLHEELNEVNPQQQPENPENYLSQLTLAAADASEVSATISSLERLKYWGMQSPRGDVFWFTAPESLYVVLPGIWSEESEEILTGWSSYVQDRLSRGFLLKDWNLKCRNEQETGGCALHSSQAAPRAASCVVALFPLHALALLVADDLNDLVTLLPPTPLVKDATEATRDHDRRQQGHTTERQQQDEFCFTNEEKQPQYIHEKKGFTLSPIAQLTCSSSSSQAGQQQDSLRSPQLPCSPCKEPGNLRQNSSLRCIKDVDIRFLKLKRLLEGHTAPEYFTESEARVAEVADHIARIMYDQAGGRTVGRT